MRFEFERRKSQRESFVKTMERKLADPVGQRTNYYELQATLHPKPYTLNPKP